MSKFLDQAKKRYAEDMAKNPYSAQKPYDPKDTSDSIFKEAQKAHAALMAKNPFNEQRPYSIADTQ
jgi:predicted KAP-like P-loop ATPase